jgi:S1-C subfamily serine protease
MTQPLLRYLLPLVVATLMVVTRVPAPAPLADDWTLPDDAAAIDLDALAAADVLRSAREFTVRIRTVGCERLGTGSGFVLENGLIVTNRHVIGQPRTVAISTWDGRSFDARVEGISLDADLAIIEVSTTDLPAATLRTGPVAVGESIAVIGYPGGGSATITTGRLVSISEETILDQEGPFLIVDAEVRQGNSGGPVVDERGAVIGVIFALDGRGFGNAIPIARLIERIAARGFTSPSGC